MKPQIKVGDIIGFSGRGKHSILINLLSYGIPRWSISHVGVMGERGGELLLFESCEDVDPTPGTQAVHLDERLEQYIGRVWHYPLYRRLFDAEAERLNKFLIEHIGISYDHVGAIRAGGKAWSWLASLMYEEDLRQLFCSEFCAAAHREIGMLRTDNVSRWSPNRFIRCERRESILAKPRRLK